MSDTLSPAAGAEARSEKPFGHDLPSAQTLNRALLTLFREDPIFRFDQKAVTPRE